MPIKTSSIRDLRLSRKRAAANRRVREHLQYLIHRYRKLLVKRDVTAAPAAAAAVIKALDRAVRAGVVKAGTAARRTSRFQRQLNRLLRPAK